MNRLFRQPEQKKLRNNGNRKENDLLKKEALHTENETPSIMPITAPKSYDGTIPSIPNSCDPSGEGILTLSDEDITMPSACDTTTNAAIDCGSDVSTTTNSDTVSNSPVEIEMLTENILAEATIKKPVTGPRIMDRIRDEYLKRKANSEAFKKLLSQRKRDDESYGSLNSRPHGDRVSLLERGSCPECDVGNPVEYYPILARILSVVLFPCGILCCVAMRKNKCDHCGYVW